MRDQCANLKAEFSNYSEWFKKEVQPKSIDFPGMGPEAFDELLRLRKLGSTREQLLELSKEKMASLESDYLVELKKLTGKDSASEGEAEWLKSTPDDFEEILDMFRKAVSASRAFVGKVLAIDSPDSEELVIMQTPKALEAVLPSAAYLEPPRFLPTDKLIGHYYVTRPQPGVRLLEHTPGMIYNVSSHEGYPGHHLQLSWGALNKSKFRALLSGDEFCEGWAHYCEEWMTEEGFEPVPGMQAAQLKDCLLYTSPSPRD